MNFYGDFQLEPGPIPETFRLHNPLDDPRHIPWGVQRDGNKHYVPDNFVTDLASSKWTGPLYPPTLAPQSDTWHDWGYRAHAVDPMELLAELNDWFTSLNFTNEQRMAYIAWLQDRPRKDWDEDHFELSELEGVSKWRRYGAYGILRLLGRFAWNEERGSKTKAYRENRLG